jgi:predicted O-methyltransferase YrrM
MTALSTLEEALRFADECESKSRHAEAEAIYRQLLQLNPSVDVAGMPIAVAIHKGLIRTAMNSGRSDDALDWFERLVPLLDQLGDAEFDPIYVRGIELTRSHPLPLPRRERFYELSALLRSTRGIDGEVAECGCFRGLSTYIIASYLKLERPQFSGGGMRVFDSFAGLSRPGAQDELPSEDQSAEAQRLRKMSRAGAFAAGLAEVKAALAEFPQIEFHVGWIPQSFAGQAERRYRFVHVDVDLYAPTLACLQYFYPRLQPGGLLVSDDFGWPGARNAINEFCGDQRLAHEVNRHEQAVLRKPR